MKILAFFGVMFVLVALCFAFFSDTKKVEVKEVEKPVEKKPTYEERRRERELIEAKNYAEAEKQLTELFKNDEKYFFTVKLKNGKTMKSKVFEGSGYVHIAHVLYHYNEPRTFHPMFTPAKVQAETAMTQSVNGFLKINDVFVNENEIVMKKIVKVRENETKSE